jgi:hypothetical protein
MRSRYVVFILLMIVMLGCASTPPAGSAPPAPIYHPHAEVDVNIFYEELAPYGTWLWLEGYGRVWQPHGVPPGWRPYTDGRWVFTDAGWTWVSDWEWGWAPFHYGRWLPSPAYGWVWVPGTVWGPAWVVWHHGSGWVGWAPLPPAAVWEPAGHLHITHVERHLHPSQFCFVRERDILAPRVHRHIVPHTENTRLVHVTKNVTNYTVINKQVVNQSIRVDSVERAAKQPVPRLRIVETDASRGVRKGQVKDQEGQVRLFRPTVGRTTSDTAVPNVPKSITHTDSDTPKSIRRTPPSGVPEREPRTPPAASAPVVRTPPASPPAVLGKESPPPTGAPAAPEQPKLSPPEELQRHRERRPGGSNRPPASTTPQVRTPPAGDAQEPRDRSRPRYQPPQRAQDKQPPTASPPPMLTTPSPPASQGTVVSPSPRQGPSVRTPPQTSDIRRERRGKRAPQGQQEQDNDGATPGGVPPAVGSGTSATPSGNPSQHSVGSRGRW